MAKNEAIITITAAEGDNGRDFQEETQRIIKILLHRGSDKREWEFVAQLLPTHRSFWGTRLRAAVVYGPLAEGNAQGRVDLLEVVENWPYPEVNPETLPEVNTPLILCSVFVISPEDFGQMVEMQHPVLLGIAQRYRVLWDEIPTYISAPLQELKRNLNKQRRARCRYLAEGY